MKQIIISLNFIEFVFQMFSFYDFFSFSMNIFSTVKWLLEEFSYEMVCEDTVSDFQTNKIVYSYTNLKKRTSTIYYAHMKREKNSNGSTAVNLHRKNAIFYALKCQK